MMRYYNTGPAQMAKRMYTAVWDSCAMWEWRISAFSSSGVFFFFLLNGVTLSSVFTAVPLVVTHQELHARRGKFLAGWLMCIPERMHVVGQMLKEQCDPLLWNRLTVDHPEIIPRHEDYHVRYY